MATIRDVAKRAGVSVATVSRALNDKGYVHDDTRKLINEAIQQLNYRPNEVARSLYNKKSRLIGLLLPDIRNPFFPELARGAEDEMQAHDYRVMIGNADEKPEKESEYIHTFEQHHVIGILSATSNQDNSFYQNLSFPVVFLDRISDQHPSVYADGLDGGKKAVREIVRRGSKRITLLRGPMELKTAQDRFRGAMEEISSKDVEFNVMKTSFAYEEAEESAKELFERFPDTDGVIASNDIAAAAVLREAHRIGKSIPEELQIIGYDDIPLSKWLYPPLSTIRQPAYDMGRTAAKLLIQLIHNEKVSHKNIQLPVAFIERQTTRKAEENG
ncbi:LacI family DNA-binding transcriptional regulator [Bacillus massiliglaciei]|uniref:LacI family DNA-binding transcriptional regulator n=1 Tax=Bacillus massiliglaciei TaxID=1816693 RepID=UPI000A81B8BA|nr:LacI family DNA-binding transcriptional regulator [Bacillus massiliglaciei]